MTKAVQPLSNTRDENFRCEIAKKLFGSYTDKISTAHSELKALEANAMFVNGLYSRKSYDLEYARLQNGL